MSDLSPEDYNVGSLFAGIGGICLGFSEAGCHIKWANEWDKFACETYRRNADLISSGLHLYEGDVMDFDPEPNVRIDILAGGFPCQPYSLAGLRKGLDDERGRGRPMFEQILRIAEICNPRVIFLENVSNLKTFDHKKTFPILMQLLDEIGYKHHPDYVLNSKDYSGIAQNRDRIYIVAFRDEIDFHNFEKTMGKGLEKIPIVKDMHTIIDSSEQKEMKYYYTKDEKGKCKSIRYYEHFVPFVTSKDIIYQYRRKYMRENKNGLCPALTACMGGGGHNVPIILDDYGIRKLTPKECLEFQGFPSEYSFPEKMADGHKYKQAGNSVTVPVIRRIAEKIVEALSLSDSEQ